MKLLHVHNFYQQPGGEDRVFASDYQVLTANGHQVFQYTKNNLDIRKIPKITLLANTFWNRKVYREVEMLIDEHHPDVCHFHNTFPLISPSAYYACRKYNVPIVQRLPNYRLICSNAFLFRNGKVCYDCIGKFIPWPGVWHACYRNSHIESAVVCGMLLFHRILKTWENQIDIFIALTEYSKKLFVSSGFPEEKIVISPNIVEPDPGLKDSPGDYALYVGRLSEEKGLNTLLNAWNGISHIKLFIVGDGPLSNELRGRASSQGKKNVILVGRKSKKEVIDMLKQARLLIFPSEWPETFGMSIIEAFACGVPVIAAHQSTTQEIVNNNVTGFLFEAGNSQDLVDKVLNCWDDLETIKRMGLAARLDYERKYSKKQKYASLMKIYKLAIQINESKHS